MKSRQGADPGRLENSARELVEPIAGWVEAHTKLSGAVADLGASLRRLSPVVMGVGTYVLDSNGTAYAQYRVQFQCITIDSQSTHVLTVANMPLQESAPGGGPGLYVIKAGGFAVVNFTGYDWSIYGGAPGEQISVTAYGHPMPPATR